MPAAVALDVGRPRAPRAGRPTAARASQIDGQIRAAARKLFLDLGFDAASMDLVARAARVSKGTLYARFASKEAMLLAVVEDLLGQLQARASSDDISLPAELAPLLREYARRLVQVMDWDEYRSLLTLTKSAARVQPDLPLSCQAAAMTAYVESIARGLAASAPAVLADHAYWQHLAGMLLHAIGGWYRSESAAGPIDRDRFDAYCEVVVGAILASIEAR